MIIKKEQAEILLKLIEKKEIDTEKHLETIDILEKSGLVEIGNSSDVSLTFSGLRVATELKSLVEVGHLKAPDEWEDDWRWIGSEIIAMLDASLKGTRVTEVSLKALSERGFVTHDREKNSPVINEAGKEILRIYRDTSPMLEIDHRLAGYIRSIPAGPTYTSSIKINGYYEHLLEAMRLIAYSVPSSEVYSFTALGQAVKNMLELGGYINEGDVLNTGIMLELLNIVDNTETENADPSRLQMLGYIDAEGRLLPAGEWALEAYRLWKDGPRTRIWSIKVPQECVEVLEIFNEPHAALSIKKMEEKLKEKKPQEFKLKEYNLEEKLHMLEAFELVEAEYDEEGNKLFKPSPYGIWVKHDRNIKNSGVSSVSVKAITMTRKTFSAPNVEWFEKAKEEGLIGSREPTKSGYMYAFLAENVERRPYINREMTRLMRYIPKHGKTVKDLIENSSEETKVKDTLDMLEANGFIEILPDENIILTEAGVHMQHALLAVPSGFSTPLTPDMCRVLLSLFGVAVAYESEKKMRIPGKSMKDAIRISGLSDKAFSDAFMACKQAGYTGTNMITEAGISVIRACEYLNERKELKSYSEIYDHKKKTLKE